MSAATNLCWRTESAGCTPGRRSDHAQRLGLVHGQCASIRRYARYLFGAAAGPSRAEPLSVKLE